MRVNALSQIFAGIVFVALSFAFSKVAYKEQPGRLILNVSHYVGKDLLKLDSATYKNKSGQNFTVTKFKYYIGAIVLKRANGSEFRSENYFLVNEEDQASKQIVLENVPPGPYSSLRFIIGVDSIHNCSGAQSGALDPVNGMFWAWNSGYIFLKLEGFSPASLSPGHLFEYHIGGYKQPVNCIRAVTIALPDAFSGTGTISLKADVMTVLEGTVSLDFGKLSSVTDFHNASVVADNYKNMFSILN